MKTFGAAALLLLAASLAVPMAASQQPGMGITLTVGTLAAPIPYEGSATLPINVTVGCIDAQQDGTVSIAAGDQPSWLTISAPDITVMPGAECLPAGTITQAGSITLSVSKDAPGVIEHSIDFVATVNTKNSDPPTQAKFSVAYFSIYTLVPEPKFPLEVTQKVTKFNVTGTQSSNAPSMIMVDGTMTASNGALVSGIASLQYNNTAGTPDTKTYTVTFTAPSGSWDNSTISLRTFGHFNFAGQGGDPMDYKNFTWEIHNGGVSGGGDGDGGGGGGKKGIPAAPAPLMSLALLAFAAFVARRR